MTNADGQRDEQRRDAPQSESSETPDNVETGGGGASPQAGEAEEVTPPDDDPELLAASRGLDIAANGSDSVEPAVPLEPRPLEEEPDGDAVAIDESVVSDEVPDDAGDSARIDPARAVELRSHRIGVELKHVELEVRSLLENRDPKRKRKLGGTARWQELEGDVLALRYSGRIDEPALARVQQLVARRRYLFGQLRFLAATRPTWNT